MTIDEWFEKWLKRRKMDVSQSTVEKNQYHAKHIRRYLGGEELDDLTFEDIEDFYIELDREEDLAANTIRSIHGTLSKAYEDAIRSRKVKVHHNPCAEANAPDEETKNFEVLSCSEARKLRRSLRLKNPYDACIYLALQTGMRKQEIMGLTWPNLDIERGVIEIKKTLTKCPRGELKWSDPKSKSSYRAVQLNQNTISKLRLYKEVQKHRKENADDWPEPKMVFTSEVGTPLYPRNIKRRLDKHLSEAGLKSIRFHDLRHTHATILLRENVHPKKVQERLGHDSVEITLDRYSHVTPTMQEEVAETFNAALE